MEKNMDDPVMEFDTVLATRFRREHAQLPEQPFVAATLQGVRAMQRRAARLRFALTIAALAAVMVASPWLIAGSAWLNSALESSLNWTAALPRTWMVGAGALALGVALAAGMRRS
jgi:hypothetical protein